MVSERAIARAIRTLAEQTGVLVEGAGAAALAALETLRDRLQGRKVALILTGGNIDSAVLARLLAESQGQYVNVAPAVKLSPLPHSFRNCPLTGLRRP